MITSLLYDPNTTLTCTSTGGPPTTVTWKKNGILVDDSVYERSQRLVFPENSTYENILFNDDVANFVGSFTCEVSNVRGSFEETVELNGTCVYIYATTICEVHASCVHVLLGVSIAHDQFYVGQPAIAACRSVTPATRIDWLRNGEVVASIASTSIQELDLVFSPVNDSIHNQVYVCRVTRDSRTVSQNFTVQVNGEGSNSLCSGNFSFHLFPQFPLMLSKSVLSLRALPQVGRCTH